MAGCLCVYGWNEWKRNPGIGAILLAKLMAHSGIMMLDRTLIQWIDHSVECDAEHKSCVKCNDTAGAKENESI